MALAGFPRDRSFPSQRASAVSYAVALLRWERRQPCGHIHISTAPFLCQNPLRLLFSAAAAGRSDDAPTQVSQCLRHGRVIDAFRLRLRSHDPSAPFPISAFSPVDPFVAVHALRSAPSPDVALSLFRSDPSFTLTHHALHELAKTLSASRRVGDLRSLLDAADAGAFPRLLVPSPMDRLRWYAAADDVPSALQAWERTYASIFVSLAWE